MHKLVSTKSNYETHQPTSVPGFHKKSLRFLTRTLDIFHLLLEQHVEAVILVVLLKRAAVPCFQ